MAENFQDNISYGGSTLAVSGDAIAVGSTNAGAKSIIFNNTGSQGHLAWQPTANRTINLPDSNGTVQLTGQVPGAIQAGTQTATSGTIIFSNSNGVTFGMSNNSVITASVVGGGNINVSAGTTSNNLTNFVFSNSNGISFGLNGSTITATVTPGAAAGVAANQAGTQTATSGTVIFSNSNGISFGMSNSSIITASYTVPTQTNQTIGLYALGNTTQNSSTTLDARTLSFNGLGAATVGYSNGSIQVSVPVQTNQTEGRYAIGNTTGQSSSSTFDARTLSVSGAGNVSVGYSGNALVISGGGGGGSVNISAGTTSNNLTNFVFSNSNSVSFGLNGSTITGSIPLQTYSFVNSNGISFGINGSTITASVAVTIAGGGSVNISAGTTSNNLTNFIFSNSNNVSFGLNGSTVTATISVPAQTAQTIGLYALGNTTQNSSTTLDARTLSFNGLGIITAGYSNGSIQISATQSNQTLGRYAIGNTTGQSSSSTFDARTMSISGVGNISVGYSGNALVISGAGGGGGVANAAGTQTATSGTIVFSNSNGITFGMSNSSVITASFNGTLGSVVFSNSNNVAFGSAGATTITASAFVNLSAGTTSGNVSNFVFSNSNGISFGLNGSTITASASAQTEGLYAIGNTTGQSSSNTFNPQTFSYSGAGNISVGYSGNALIISGGNITLSAWEPYAANTGSAVSSHAPASYWFNRIQIPEALAISNINMIKSHSASGPPGTTTNSSGTNVFSYSHGVSIFTRQNMSNSSTNLSLYTTASHGVTLNLTHSSSSISYAASWVTNTTGGTSSFSTSSSSSGWVSFLTGLKLWQIPMITTLSAGEYFFAHRQSSTSASTGGAANMFSISNLHLVQQVSTIGVMTSSGSLVSSHFNGIGHGIASAVTTNATMAASVISANTQQFWYLNFSNA